MFGLPPPDPAFEFSVASRGMSKGIAQTDDEPQALLKASGKSGPLEVGGQWKNVTSASAKGEAAVFVNANHAFGKLRLNAGVAYKFQTGVSGNPDTIPSSSRRARTRLSARSRFARRRSTARTTSALLSSRCTSKGGRRWI